MIKLTRPDLAKNPAQSRCVGQVSVVQEQILAVNLLVAQQMLDPRTEQIAGPPHDSVNSVTLLQKQLGQIRTILPGDSGDKGSLAVAHGVDLTTEWQVENLP